MNNDGIVQGADSLRALHWLAGEQQDGQPALAIDVLCVAYGYEPGRADADHTARLRSVLWQLAGCGVIVVASAGNDGDDSPVYPAAFAVDPNPPPVPIISVGATNPDGSYAHYSNYGVWVTHRAVGSGVISTITAFDGSRVAPRQTAYPDSIGVPIDPDDFRGGFARWSGTSFAAATVAGGWPWRSPAPSLPRHRSGSDGRGVRLTLSARNGADVTAAFDERTEAGPASRPARLGALLKQAQDGDTAALHDVVRELNPLLWQVARAQGLGPDEAADVVQTTWLELLRRLREIRSPSALTAWLVTATRREAMRVHRGSRKAGSQGNDVLDDLADVQPEVSERLIARERHLVLMHHFRLLSERCRSLLRILAQADRPDYDTVGQALGMPRGSIGPTRGRCLAQLRTMLMADPRWDPA